MKESTVVAGNIVRIVYNEAKAKLPNKVGIDEITRQVAVILDRGFGESCKECSRVKSLKEAIIKVKEPEKGNCEDCRHDKTCGPANAEQCGEKSLWEPKE